MDGWLQALSAQLFRDELVIAPERFLRGNFVIGLFLAIVSHAGMRQPERTNAVLSVLVALSMVVHLVGLPLVTAFRSWLAPVLCVQGLALLATTASLVTMSAWLTFQATELSNIRYLPGIALCLCVYASLELHFFGPRQLRRLPIRRLGIALGAAAELALIVSFARFLLRS